MLTKLSVMEEPECAICLEVINPINPGRQEIFDCCVGKLHLSCFMDCLMRHGRCPICQVAIPVYSYYFLGLERSISVSHEAYEIYNGRRVLKVKHGNYIDLGPWVELDQFMTAKRKRKLHQKQLEYADVVIAKLDSPALDWDELEMALRLKKRIVILENRRAKRSNGKVYQRAYESIGEISDAAFLFEPLKGHYASKGECLSVIKGKRKKIGTLSSWIKSIFGYD
jgi:hypothetical protein